MKLLELRDVTVRYGHKTVVNAIDWELREGENWAFLGLNGSGKTTLLSVMAGYMGASSGKVYMQGTEVTAQTKMLLRQQVGFVSNSFFNRVFHREQVLDIILSGKTEELAVHRQLISMKDVQRARDLMDVYQLGEYLRYSYDMLSKGQQQCVLLARALMKENRLLILDEPCEGLDVMKKDLFLQQIRGLCSEQTSIVYVTHHLEELDDKFNRAFFMRDGQKHSAGDFVSMFSVDNLEDFFQHPVRKTNCGHRMFLEFDWSERLCPKECDPNETKICREVP